MRLFKRGGVRLLLVPVADSNSWELKTTVNGETTTSRGNKNYLYIKFCMTIEQDQKNEL
jgi:hypothetical protein